jgi:phosphate transport system substrate-binding protein
MTLPTLRQGLFALVTFATLATALPVVAAPAPAAAAASTVQVKGSDTIGGKLGQDFARAYTALHPGVDVRWEALGSGTAFVGLLDGSAQLGAASRPVNEKELADAAKLGLKLQEFVIGYDGIAVVVNPANPVSELTVAQVADLFIGKLRNWSEVGGPDLPVRLISRPSYSGTFSFFREHVLRRGNAKGPEDYAAGTEFVEENGAILKKVSQERGAVSYVGIGWVTPEVKVLGVAPKSGQPAVRASVATVRTGTYPIYRPLLMYSRGEPHGEARNLLAFVLSSDGQKIVARNDFVPTDSPAPLAPEGAAAAAPAAARGAAGSTRAAGAAGGPAGAGGGAVTSPEAPRMIRVLFPRGAELTAAARTALSTLTESMPPEGSRLLVVGHADVRGSRAANARVSLARARAVARYLEQLGVPASAIQVEARGAEEPVETNTSGTGRGANRRVDVTILPPQSATTR